MKPIQTVLTFLLAVTLLLGGCSGSSEAKSPDAQTAPTEETVQTEETEAPTEEATTESEDMAASETETTEVAANTEENASTTGGETYQVKMGSDTGQL